MSNHGALVILDIDSALAEIRNGTIAKTIAQRYGVSAQHVRNTLRKSRPDEYKDAVAEQTAHWVDESAEEIRDKVRLKLRQHG